MNKTMTVVETVRFMGYSRATIYPLLVEEKLEAKKNVDGEWQISTESVRRYVKRAAARRTRGR